MIKLNGNIIEQKTFPDGTSSIRIPTSMMNFANTITWLYDDDSEMMRIIYIVNHLRENGYEHINLVLPYIPNARMDRVKYEDEVFTLKYFANIINSLNFNNVFTLDAHSNVSLALIDRVKNASPFENVNKVLASEMIGDKKNLVFYFPDEGAMKRYGSISELLSIPYVFGMKRRDWRTGKIEGIDVLGATDELEGKSVLIVDDICSKGGTFYYSAMALKALGVADIYLYVSHLENSVHDGEMIESGLIKQIFTTDSIYRECDKHPDMITII